MGERCTRRKGIFAGLEKGFRRATAGFVLHAVLTRVCKRTNDDDAIASRPHIHKGVQVAEPVATVAVPRGIRGDAFELAEVKH